MKTSMELLALLAIVVPWLMSDPAPREERPQPTFVIEQPVDVARQEVPAPQMPESIATPAPSEPVETDEALEEPIDEMPRAPQTDQVVRAEASSAQEAPSESMSSSTTITYLVYMNWRRKLQTPSITRLACPGYCFFIDTTAMR